MGELDDYLRSRREQDKQKGVSEDERNRKAYKFNTAFKEVRDRVIYPAMIDLISKLRSGGLGGKAIRENETSPYYSKRFYVYPATGNRIYIILSAIGNSDLEKVCLVIDYITDEHGGGTVKQKTVHKTEEQYTLDQINAALLEKTVVNGIKQAAELQLK